VQVVKYVVIGCFSVISVCSEAVYGRVCGQTIEMWITGYVVRMRYTVVIIT